MALGMSFFKKRYKALMILIFSFSDIIASPQMPDYIIYKNDTIPSYNLLVEQYLQKNGHASQEQLFGLSFRDGSSFNCWRGYQAIYKLENDSLLLTAIIDCGTLRRKVSGSGESAKKIKSIFAKKMINGKVFIDWFTGDLNFPLTNKILRWDGVFYRIFENETVLHIANGHVSGVENVNNYIENANAIHRRYGAKLSDTLFGVLKNIKWKNPEQCDCSEKYAITINKRGRVSKIAMVEYKTAGEIKANFEKGEYRYCINTIHRALRKLKFDIIKDKGKPIAEDVFLEIWINDDGKIDNWTN